MIKKGKKWLLQAKVSGIEVAAEHTLAIYIQSAFYTSFVQRYLILRDPKSGRSLHLKIIDGVALLNLADLELMTPESQLEVSIARYSSGKKSGARLTLVTGFDTAPIVFAEGKLRCGHNPKIGVFIQYFSNAHFEYSVDTVHKIETDFQLKGTIRELSTIAIEKVEIVLKGRQKAGNYGYAASIQRDELGQVKFEAYIDTDKFSRKVMHNARLDVYLQIRDKLNNIVYSRVLLHHNSEEDMNDEDRYLVPVPLYDKKVAVVYLTEGKKSIAIWVTDSEQYERTYNIAAGRTHYFRALASSVRNPKKVFFESFLGNTYAGNPKYLYEYLLMHKDYKDYEFVWSYNAEDGDKIPGNPILVERGSADYFKHLAEAKFWVNNVVFPTHIKPEDTVYIQTWHGTPLKRLGFDIEIAGPEVAARENFYLESRNWDYLVSDNSYSSDIFRRAFKFEKDVLEVGYPLNDTLINQNRPKAIKELKKKLGLPLNKKIVLYAPTWRDDESDGSWNHSFSLKIDLAQFKERLGSSHVLLLKMHHLIANKLEIDETMSTIVKDYSHIDDIQLLYLVADILITDYSSVFFDYANLSRPILFYAYDFKKYSTQIRGFYLNMHKDLPGPVIESSPALLDAISNIDTVKLAYADKYNKFQETYCYLDDGQSAARIEQQVFRNYRSDK